MEFDKSRVFSSVNADELKAGDKVITARCMADLKTWVEADAEPNVIELIQDETNTDRFTCKCHGSNKTYDCPLAYLVERKENCTNCGKHEDCGFIQNQSRFANLNRCEDWKPKTEKSCTKCRMATKLSDGTLACDVDGFPVDCTPPHDEACSDYKPKKEDNMWNYESLPERQEMGVSDHVIVAVEGCPYGQSGYYDFDLQAWFVDGCSEPVNVVAWQKVELPKIEQKEMCLNCKHYNKVNDFRDCTLVDNPTYACPHYEAEKHYRPFANTDELIKVWDAKIGTPNWGTAGDLTMPLIWVREKGCNKSADLITCYGSKGITVRGEGMYFDTLFTMFEFLDGTPCGVEE